MIDPSVQLVFLIVWLIISARSIYLLQHAKTCARMKFIILIFIGLTIASFIEFIGFQIGVLFHGLALLGSWVVLTRWWYGKSVEWDKDI